MQDRPRGCPGSQETDEWRWMGRTQVPPVSHAGSGVTERCVSVGLSMLNKSAGGEAGLSQDAQREGTAKGAGLCGTVSQSMSHLILTLTAEGLCSEKFGGRAGQSTPRTPLASVPSHSQALISQMSSMYQLVCQTLGRWPDMATDC